MGRKGLVALTAVAALALGGAAVARAVEHFHEVDLLLPDGSVERIRYTGDVAPRVALVPVAAAMPATADPSGDDDLFGFAAFDRMAEAMHAQAAAMLRQASLLAARPQGAGAPGTVSYSFVSTSGDGRTCSRSIRVTSFEAGTAPEVIRRSSGDCQPGGKTVTPAVQPPAAPALPPLVPVSTPAEAKPAVKTTRT